MASDDISSNEINQLLRDGNTRKRITDFALKSFKGTVPVDHFLSVFIGVYRWLDINHRCTPMHTDKIFGGGGLIHKRVAEVLERVYS